MKIIGKGQHHNEYIATVTHTELEKCFDKYYGKESLKEFKAGDEVDIAAGYNFRRDINEACRKMTEAMRSFDEAKKTLTEFAIMVSKLPEQKEDE